MEGKVLTNRNFRLYLFGIATSTIGNIFYGFATSWYILSLTGSALQFSLFFIVGNVIRSLTLLFSGRFIDTHNKLNIMIYTDFIRGTAIALGALLMYVNPVSSFEVIALYLINIILSVCDAFFVPASNAIIPQIVEKDHLTQAWSLYSLVDNIDYMVSMALVGILYPLIGVAGIFAIDAITYFISALSEKLIVLKPSNETVSSVKKNYREKSSKNILANLKVAFTENRKVYYLLFLFSFYSFFAMALGRVGYSYLFNQVLEVQPIYLSIFNFIGIIGGIIVARKLYVENEEFNIMNSFKESLGIIFLITVCVFSSIYYWQKTQYNMSILIILLCVYNFVRSASIEKLFTHLNVVYSNSITEDQRATFYANKDILTEIVMAVSTFVAGIIIDFSFNSFMLFVLLGFMSVFLFALTKFKYIDMKSNN